MITTKKKNTKMTSFMKYIFDDDEDDEDEEKEQENFW
jgi:hypothetical protein